jgi:methylase of polypeptide subunit release factors
MKIESTDYHDYVIKNGKLIGEFEQMYQNSSTIPWHQDEQENWIDVCLTIEFLKKKQFSRIVDYGAGTGHYLDILMRRTCADNGVGFDISDTAVEKAMKSFPKYIFKKGNLVVEDVHQFFIEPISGGGVTCN